jgi:phosphoglycerate dehydrogenase-like enzyme
MKQIVATLLCFCSLGYADSKKILAPALSDSEIQTIQAAVPGARIVKVQGPAIAREIEDADAIIGGVSRENFSRAKKLKWVHVMSAGVEKDLFPELINSEVVVTNAKNVYGPQIADHAFAFLLSLTRRLNVTIPKQHDEEWPRGRSGMFELNGKTAVIIGVGGIGSQIAQRANGFGMKVIGVDVRDYPPSTTVQRYVHPDMLDSVLPQADVVFISVPHTKKSEGMMGRKEFELMKKGSYFIAVSRGKIYSMDGLVKALDEGRLAGAGVDVTDPEPLPKGHPLWKFPNVVITPHTAGGSDRLEERIDHLIQENVRRFVAGEVLLNVVDKNAGF